MGKSEHSRSGQFSASFGVSCCSWELSAYGFLIVVFIVKICESAYDVCFPVRQCLLLICSIYAYMLIICHLYAQCIPKRRVKRLFVSINRKSRDNIWRHAKLTVWRGSTQGKHSSRLKGLHTVERCDRRDSWEVWEKRRFARSWEVWEAEVFTRLPALQCSVFGCMCGSTDTVWMCFTEHHFTY